MKAQKVGKMAIFSVGAVLFSAHAGGGFATGNQANTYYVGLGWTGIVSAIIAMLLLILTMREAMVMYNQRNLTSAKELFENLYHPFDKLEILFEIFFNIMVLMLLQPLLVVLQVHYNNTLDLIIMLVSLRLESLFFA